MISFFTFVSNQIDRIPDDEPAAFCYVYYLAGKIFYSFFQSYQTWKKYSTQLEPGVINEWNQDIEESLTSLVVRPVKAKTTKLVTEHDKFIFSKLNSYFSQF